MFMLPCALSYYPSPVNGSRLAHESYSEHRCVSFARVIVLCLDQARTMLHGCMMQHEHCCAVLCLISFCIAILSLSWVLCVKENLGIYLRQWRRQTWNYILHPMLASTCSSNISPWIVLRFWELWTYLIINASMGCKQLPNIWQIK